MVRGVGGKPETKACRPTYSMSASLNPPRPEMFLWLLLCIAVSTMLSQLFVISPVVLQVLAISGTPIGPWTL